ncbi:hypothetical protein KTR66_08765 [Roseococcus sp. SDR]|uniref:hypothetical protein n=1 Tax=Roseococcus sp. SDR TaxID=2835532 RepID=UPI001BD1929E|nr:hypothetical protein [Roseococcus sp. SDR]MBS7790084.1 hypothetical protein [Roseococcus sp. SDR]MBV1845398.1 hypothetical protein [Roseococcus sp. SDR]
MSKITAPRPAPRPVDNYPDDLPFPVCHDCGALDPVMSGRTTECLMCGYVPGVGHVSSKPDVTSAETEPKSRIEVPGRIPPWKRDRA